MTSLCRIDLSARELALLGEGPLSVSDSKRMLDYLGSAETDPAIEAWLANPVGPVPWPEDKS